MKDIITVKKDECFIDSENLALMSDNEHRAVRQLIRNYKTDLEKFGVLTFEMSKPNKDGGRPKTTYLLNEQQATLLTTFMKNSEKVRLFKVNLVNEFFKMREYINSQKLIRLTGKEIRKSLTEAVDQSGENERMHGHGYSSYTKMVYELTNLQDKFKFWKLKSKAFRDEYKGNFRDYISSDELDRVKQAEALIKPLLEMDKQYSEIKDTLKPLFSVKELS